MPSNHLHGNAPLPIRTVHVHTAPPLPLHMYTSCTGSTCMDPTRGIIHKFTPPPTATSSWRDGHRGYGVGSQRSEIAVVCDRSIDIHLRHLYGKIRTDRPLSWHKHNPSRRVSNAGPIFRDKSNPTSSITGPGFTDNPSHHTSVGGSGFTNKT